MLKKMMLLGLAVVALAAPAAAQGQPLLTDVDGDLAVGAGVTATSTNLVTKSPLGELTCEKVTIHGTVTKNDTTSAVIGSTATTVEGCNTPITNQTAGTITINNNGTGIAAGATFVAAGLCDYAGSIPFTYVTNTDVLTVAGSEQFTGAGACGKATMTGSFTLETSNGKAVTIR